LFEFKPHLMFSMSGSSSQYSYTYVNTRISSNLKRLCIPLAGFTALLT
jgi:hypothetical protein